MVHKPRATREELFWKKVDKRGPDECWPWLASRTGGKQEYGQFYFGPDRGCGTAHRFSYELHFGPIPEGTEVDHVDCETKLCVNPAHLQAIPHADNVRRGKSGKHNADKTHCPAGHPYGEKSPDGRRRCRVCRSRAAKIRLIERRG